MTRHRRRVVAIAAAVVALASFTAGCSKKKEFEQEVFRAIDKTERESMRFAYLDRDLAGNKVQVTGLVEDDYRYKARLSVDDKPLWDEVVNDDAVADLFIEPQGVLDYSVKVTLDAIRQAKGGPAAVAGSTESGSDPGAGNPFLQLAGSMAYQDIVQVSPPQIQPQMKALAERRWVLDPTGAPTLVVAVNDPRQPGADPFFDARTVLDYTHKAVDAAQEVTLYDAESLEPTYKPAEDPFPKPKKGSGVRRFDLKEPSLPTNQASSRGAVRQIAPPTAVHFRKMAIYLKNGRVVEVREQIDIQRKLKEFSRNYDVPFKKGLSAAEQVQQALVKINELGRATSSPPLRVRSMTVQFRDFDDPTISVDLPTDNVVTGSLLNVIPNRGRSLKKASPTPTLPEETASTTAPAPAG